MPSSAGPRGIRAPTLLAALVVAMLVFSFEGIAGDAPAATNTHTGGLATGSPKLPADARAVAERLASCTHFMGEFNGDRSEHDREVNATLTELRCDRIDADVAVIRKKYPRDAAVQKALADATAL